MQEDPDTGDPSVKKLTSRAFSSRVTQPERLQASELKTLGIHDSNGNTISGTATAGTAGTTVFLTDWTAPSTGRFYIAVGSENNDRTGVYWLSIIKDATN